MKKIFVLAFITAFSLISVGIIFSQEETESWGVPPPEAAVGPETQWVWGEVVNVDAGNRSILVKYLDYETDQEKEISISTDEKTTFEGAANIDGITPADTVSIDYVISPDGKNIATNVSAEKPQSQEIPQQEAAPQDLSPAQTESQIEEE